MIKRFTAFAFVAVLVSALILGAQPAVPVEAFATADVVVMTCSSFHVEGTSDAPYAIVYAENLDTNDAYWIDVPVVGGVYSATLTFPEFAAGTSTYYGVWGGFGTGMGWTDWDSESYWAADSVECVPAAVEAAIVPGPDVPDGFVQSVFTCDTALFVGPAGEKIADDLVTAGQTFYVNPVGEEGADGQMWHEIFVGSYDLPYVPAACVAAAQ